MNDVPSFQVRIEYEVEAEMRDGVILRANVFRPDAEDQFPVLLCRTCYSKDSAYEFTYTGFDPTVVARHGFIVVWQDVRGRYCSDGEWKPFEQERRDSYDSIEWAAKLPGSNGRVGMFGGSYVGGTQWAGAVEGAPSLKAIAPLFTWSDPLDGSGARGGALEWGLSPMWTLMQGFDFIERETPPNQIDQKYDELIEAVHGMPSEGYWELPTADWPTRKRLGLPSSRSMTGVASDEELAAVSRWRDCYDDVNEDLASYNTGGWYDLLLQGTLDNYMGMRRIGRDARLVVGPWTHDAFSDPVGDQNYGVESGREGFVRDQSESWLGRHLAWYKRHLTPDDSIQLPEKRVRIWVMGRNEWREEDTWPLERAVDTRWYLRADGGLAADGPASGAGTSEFDYDPEDPVPVHGGNGALIQGHRNGPVDQESTESRDDVLVFSSAPLSEDLEVTGRVRAVLTVESSAPSTDWVARLCDVDERGRSINLCDGITRIEEDADQLGQVEIDLWSTSNVFLKGHRVRVQVTSSNFPRWDRNLNTGDQLGSRMELAHQTLHHGGDGSYVELPVVLA